MAMIFSPPSPTSFQQALQIPCSPERIAAAWYYALTEDYPEEYQSPETLQQFIRLTQWGCAALQTIPVDTERAAIIGAALIDMGFDQPIYLGRTISIWSVHLVEPLNIDALVLVYPQVRALIQALSDGFMRRLQERNGGPTSAPYAGLTPEQRLRADPAVPQRNVPALSPNETAMLGLLMAGKTNREISVLLMISEKAVEKRLTKLFATLNVKSRTEAIAWAIQTMV